MNSLTDTAMTEESIADYLQENPDFFERHAEMLTGVRLIDHRASLLPTDKVVEEAAFDKYNYIRDAYLQNRRSEIKDGNSSR